MIDNSLSIPVKTMKDIYGLSDDSFSVIAVQVSKGSDLSRVEQGIKKALRKTRHVKEGNEDFYVSTPQKMMSEFNSIVSIVMFVIAGIAAISLVVGAVGIMNTMYTSVLERTKEIGIMKAVGARNSDIKLIFMVESGILGFFGGTIGVAVGMIISFFVSAFVNHILDSKLLVANFNAVFIALILLFSFFLGLASGVMPATRASRLQPVEALRFKI